MVAIGPGEKIEVEVILKVWGIKDLIWFFADLAHFLLWVWLYAGQRFRDVQFALFLVRAAAVLLAEEHDFVIGLDVYLIEDAFVEELLITGAADVSGSTLALHLKGTRTHLTRDEAISSWLGLQILLVF